MKQRLDLFLMDKLQSYSRASVQKIIKSGQVSINDAVITKPSYLVSSSLGNMCYNIIPRKFEPNAIIPENLPLDIIYEDQDVLVLNKPRGMLVHPGAGHSKGTLLNALLYHYPYQLDCVGDQQRPGLVHRLDKDTSGLMVVAKTNHAYCCLVAQFASRTITRQYFALVWGCTPEVGIWEYYLAHSQSNYAKMIVNHHQGKYAKTTFKTLSCHYSLMSLLSCSLHTGRTHQIRAHANYAGYPLVGDPLYGKQRAKLSQKMNINLKQKLQTINFQCLHAYNLQFIHPQTQKLVQFTTLLPSDMASLLEF